MNICRYLKEKKYNYFEEIKNKYNIEGDIQINTTTKEINHCDECGRRIEGNITDTCFSCYLELNEDGEE